MMTHGPGPFNVGTGESLTIGDEKDRLLVPAPGGGWLLNGLPLEFTELCASVGAPGDLVLANPRGYYMAMRQAVESVQSMHLYFDTGEMAWRWTMRVGGQPKLSAPVTGAHTATTRGDFIVLAAR